MLRALLAKVSCRSWLNCTSGHLYGTSSLSLLKGKTSSLELDTDSVDVGSVTATEGRSGVPGGHAGSSSPDLCQTKAQGKGHVTCGMLLLIQLYEWGGKRFSPFSTSVICRVIKC